MGLLSKWVSKYSGKLRSLKLVYVLNNLLKKEQLQHNVSIYEKYGLQKSIFSSLGKQDFKTSSDDIPWLDQDEPLVRLKAKKFYKEADEQLQTQLVNFVEHGFMVLPEFFNSEEVARLNTEVDKLLETDEVDFNYTGKKIMESFKHSEMINKDYFRNPRLLELLDFVMGKKIVPFHTINFIQGSEQKAHSDSIHMTTEPEGYLVATWTALEATHENNGPLFYYPDSHRLPYITCQDYDSGNNRWLIGNNSYKKYEDKIAEMIAEKNLKKEYFYAEPGDLFIWHANLLHGGDPIKQEGLTRKSMVAHYFCEEVICYHEISQRPALIPNVE
jgi:hypothetical protein